MQKKFSESCLGGTNCFNSAFFLSPKPGVGLRLTRPFSSSHGRREENAHFIFSPHVRILRKCFFQHTYNSCCWIFCSRSESVITNEFMRHTKLFSGATNYLLRAQVLLNNDIFVQLVQRHQCFISILKRKFHLCFLSFPVAQSIVFVLRKMIPLTCHTNRIMFCTHCLVFVYHVCTLGVG